MHENKYKASLALVIIGCLFLLFVKILPVSAGFILSLKDYQVMSGFSGSPWVGLRNFQQLLSNVHMPRVFMNTVRLNVSAAFCACIISAIFIYSAQRIANRTLSFALTAAFALFAFMPPVISAGFLAFTFGIEIGNYYGLFYTLFEGLRLSGYIALAAFFMSSNTGYDISNPKNALKTTGVVLAIALLAGIANLMSSDFEIASVLQNPLIYERADVVDTYTYRTGLMQMNFGTSSALWVVKYIIELIACALAAVGVFVLLKSTKKVKLINSESAGSDTANKVICSVLAAVSVLLCAMVLIPKAGTDIGVQLNMPLNLTYFISFLLISVVSAAFAALLAYPFAAGRLSHKIIYAIFLVPSLYSINIIQRHLLYRSIGIINTIFPMLLAGLIPIWMIAAYAIVSNRPGALPVQGANDYIRAIAPSGFMLAAINFTLMWGGFKQPMLYTMDPSKFTAALTIRNVMMAGNQSLALNLFAFVPILIVFAAAWFAAEACRKKYQ